MLPNQSSSVTMRTVLSRRQASNKIQTTHETEMESKSNGISSSSNNSNRASPINLLNNSSAPWKTTASILGALSLGLVLSIGIFALVSSSYGLNTSSSSPLSHHRSFSPPSHSTISTSRRILLGMMLNTDKDDLSKKVTLLDDKIHDNDSDENDDKIDIDPHNKICRDYLKSFLEGTTDARDECQGLENAYDAADCEHDTFNINYSTFGRHHNQQRGNNDSPFYATFYFSSNSTDDTTDNDDEVPAIDDFFEEFQCCKEINKHYASRCLYPHQKLASLSILGIVIVLLLCNIVKTFLQTYHLHYLPEAGGCILVGAVVGGVLKASLPEYQIQLGSFDEELFLYILLPPIIFQAALSINKDKFSTLLFPISMFAILGTVLSAVLTGLTVYCITSLSSVGGTDHDLAIPLLDSMIFGALISSIDPVATLSILGSMGISDENVLYVLVFGESLLNDGVSIAMFDSLVMHLNGDSYGGNNANSGEDSILNGGANLLIYESSIYFLRVASISILVGLASGFLCTMYFWALRGRQHPVMEVGTFFCFALLPYYVSDGLNCSGIVSIMTVGFLMDIFVRGRRLTDLDLHSVMLLEQEQNQQLRLQEEEGAEAQIEMPVADHVNGYVSMANTSTAIEGSGVATQQFQQPQSDQYPHTMMPPRYQFPTYSDFRVMFSGVGHMSNQAKLHVGFVTDVISHLMETAIFAYLGLFLFNDNRWKEHLPLVFTGIFACVVGRTLMIGIVSLIVNLGIFIMRRFAQFFHFFWGYCQHYCSIATSPSTSSGANSYFNVNVRPLPLADPEHSSGYIDRSMQTILLFSGVRGAVSLALVENIPLFDAVTKEGSKYKPALKAMTNASIIFTVFFFGASTYFALRKQRSETAAGTSGFTPNNNSSHSHLGVENGDGGINTSRATPKSGDDSSSSILHGEVCPVDDGMSHLMTSLLHSTPEQESRG